MTVKSKLIIIHIYILSVSKSVVLKTWALNFTEMLIVELQWDTQWKT